MQCINRRRVLAIAASLLAIPGLAASDDGGRGPAAGRIAFQYTGRVSLNFLTGSGVVYGHLTLLDGLPAGTSLFQGAPSEATALLTFRANIQFQPLPPNGDLGGGNFAVMPILVTPGDFSVYYTSNPKHDWSNPDTFSSGQPVATFARQVEQFSVLGAISINSASAELRSSAPFPMGGRYFNLRSLVPNGVTNITTGPNAPLPGSTQTSPIFAFAGYALAIGN